MKGLSNAMMIPASNVYLDTIEVTEDNRANLHIPIGTNKYPKALFLIPIGSDIVQKDSLGRGAFMLFTTANTTTQSGVSTLLLNENAIAPKTVGDNPYDLDAENKQLIVSQVFNKATRQFILGTYQVISIIE